MENSMEIKKEFSADLIREAELNGKGPAGASYCESQTTYAYPKVPSEDIVNIKEYKL